MTTDLITFSYDGNDVTFDPSVQMWNLNAMHRATGSDPNKAPAQWLRSTQAQDVIEALTRRLNVEISHILQARRGIGGGTWAVQQLTIIYAHYLNPDFYLQWNEWALAHVTGPQQSAQAARVEELPRFLQPAPTALEWLINFATIETERKQ